MARVIVYLIILLLAVLTSLLQGQFLNFDLLRSFYVVVSLGLVLHLLPLLFKKVIFTSRKWLIASFVADVVLISVLTYLSEINQSLFLFMYLLVIVLCGLSFQARGAFLLSLLCSIGFTAASILGPEIKSLSFLFLLIINNLAFYTVAWISGYLSDQLNVLGTKLESQNLTLRTIQKLNQAMIETIPSGLVSTTWEGEVLTYNTGAERIFGEKIGEAAVNISALGIDVTQSGGREIDLPNVDGLDMKLRVTALLQDSNDLGQKTKLFIIEDLSQIRRLEFAIRQSEKMAAIGQLAAGIAHEIRNPLAGISGSIELLSQTSHSEDDRKLTKIILREIDRLNNLISEFLDFAKPDKIPSDPIDLATLIPEVLALAQPSAPQGLQLSVQLDPDSMLLGSRDKIKQALLNMVINAYQAMKGVEQPRFSIETRAQGTQLILVLKDSGLGMSDEVKKRIFEPFMTTKPKGTGLGLAITHKILESHHAQIFVESQQGLGSEFIITFQRM